MHHHNTARHAQAEGHPTVDDLKLHLRDERARRDSGVDPILSPKTPYNLARIERLNDLRFGA